MDIQKDLMEHFTGDAGESLIQKIKTFIQVKKQISQLESSVKEYKSDLREIQEEIVIEMDNDNIQKMSVDGQTIYIRENFYASFDPERKTEGYTWLKENDYDDYITETIHSKRLSALIKERLDIGEENPEFINTKVDRLLGMRKV